MNLALNISHEHILENLIFLNISKHFIEYIIKKLVFVNDFCSRKCHKVAIKQPL